MATTDRAAIDAEERAFARLGLERPPREEGKAPDLVIEVLSPSTAERDKGEKKQIYQNNIGVREYVWYDPDSDELAAFLLHDRAYVPIPPDADGRVLCPSVDLLLVRWDGVYLERGGPWLRWATRQGRLLPTGEEAGWQLAEAERQRAEQAERELAEMQALLDRYRDRFGDLAQ